MTRGSDTQLRTRARRWRSRCVAAASQAVHWPLRLPDRVLQLEMMRFCKDAERAAPPAAAGAEPEAKRQRQPAAGGIALQLATGATLPLAKCEGFEVYTPHASAFNDDTNPEDPCRCRRSRRPWPWCRWRRLVRVAEDGELYYAAKKGNEAR